MIVIRKIKSDKVLEAGNSNRNLAEKIGRGEIEMDDICEPLKPIRWEVGITKVIARKTEVSQRGKVEERNIELTARQVKPTEVQGNDSPGSHVTGDALPVAAVFSSLPGRQIRVDIGE